MLSSNFDNSTSLLLMLTKCHSRGAALSPPVGPGQRPGGGSGGEAPGSSWILVILEVKFNHIVCPHTCRWSYTLSFKKKCTFIDTWSSENISSLIYLFIIELWYESIYLYFLDLNPYLIIYTHSYSHHVLRTLSQQIFLVFFHENIVG